jgi:bacteriocin biosynthesis cyclodehydratase domain-containing protein
VEDEFATRPTTRDADGMAFRPALRPGAPLLRRDATHLQVGTSPGIVIADRPGLADLLRLLDGARDVERLSAVARSAIPELDVPVAEVLAGLRSAGVVFDATRWSRTRQRGLEAEARHADLHGSDPARLGRRQTYGLALHSDSGSRQLTEIAGRVLADSGLTRLDAADPDLLVIASCGEPARTVFEQPVRLGLDHLPVVIDEDRVRIGPLVRPGRTPCVSCHDLHRSDWDRAWPALMHQLGRHTATMTPPAVDALTTHAAALELAAEVLAHADGHVGRTVGRCLVVGPEHDERTTWPLAFHQGCACDLLRAA